MTENEQRVWNAIKEAIESSGDPERIARAAIQAVAEIMASKKIEIKLLPQEAVDNLNELQVDGISDMALAPPKI